MVRKVTKYADGGKVERDHSFDTDYKFPRPTYGEAVVDRLKRMVGGGAAGRAAKKVKGRERQINRQLADMGE